MQRRCLVCIYRQVGIPLSSTTCVTSWADYYLLWSASPYSHMTEVMCLSSIFLQAFELICYETRHVKLKHNLALEQQLYRSRSHPYLSEGTRPHLSLLSLTWKCSSYPLKSNERQLAQGRLTHSSKTWHKQALWSWDGSISIACQCGTIPTLALTVYLQLGKPLIPKGLCVRQPPQNKHKLPPIVSCRQLQLLPTFMIIFPCQSMQ